MHGHESGKAAVDRFLEAFSRSDYDAAFAEVANDAVWNLQVGDAEPTPLARDEIKRQIDQSRAAFAEPLSWHAIDARDKDGQVVVALEGRGLTRGGHLYRNRYRVGFSVQNGRITVIDEQFGAEPFTALIAAITAEAEAA